MNAGLTNPAVATPSADSLAAELLGLFGTGRQIAPLSSRLPSFGVEDAYAVAEAMRRLRNARGETVAGRKIGLTNRAVWQALGIDAPIWNYMFGSTVHDLAKIGGTFSLAGFAEPRVEAEIVLHLARAPHAGMTDEELIGCIDWIAHGFEVVHSIYPGWKFLGADAIAGFGVHAASLVGPRVAISNDRSSWLDQLSRFSVTLGSEGVTRSGQARDLLGGPVGALRHLVDELERRALNEKLQPGEIVTTGSLTEAMPVRPGDRWATQFTGIGLSGADIRFV